jgi:excisionase family DNA binding protein
VTPLARALLDELSEADLRALAERLRPFLSNQDTAEDGWLTARDAAAYVGLSVHALHRLTAERSIPFHQDGPGCKLWFRRSELDQWRSRG